ncbi:FAD-dependent oxidoreductase [Candidatus Bathyarchaeota archaeon]|nr:FAD-dependent oxidoreductase [Candidatus Bathyarchaeota archaeon]
MSRLVNLSGDVIVVGGGVAGVCAAISAARSGTRTILIQDRPVLGGNASSEIRVHIGGASEHGYHYDARESGVIEEIRLETAVRDPFNTSAWIDTVLLSACKKESLLEILLNTYVFDSSVEDGFIRSVMAHDITSETTYNVVGKIFVDGTGHGSLGALAGAEFRMGREARGEFKEDIAPETADDHTLGASILFRAEDMDRPINFTPPSWAKDFSKNLPPRTILGKSSNHPRYWHADTAGWWWVEHGGMLDTIHDNHEIRDELQSIILGAWDYIKNHHPADEVRRQAENFDITWMGALPGHRESRRLMGDYILKQQDLESCRIFEDQIAVGGWSMDLHPPGGFWDSNPSASHTYMEVPYTIPYRAIYSKNVKNLFMGSRCISATHVAHGSTRLIGTLALVGQAAGTAAHACIKHGCLPRDLLAGYHIQELQQKLLKEDHWLIGIPADDPLDLAADATIMATSEYPCCFDSHDAFIPLYFPVAQRFHLPNQEKGANSCKLSLFLRNASSKTQKVRGGMRLDDGRLYFTAKEDLATFTASIPPCEGSWIECTIEPGDFTLQAAGNYWIYVDGLDEDGVEWGMDRFQWPGTRTGLYNEEQDKWMIHRGTKNDLYHGVLGARGTFCFKLENVPSPYPATAINNGFHRPGIAPNLWISAPVREGGYTPPILLEGNERSANKEKLDTPPLDDVEIRINFPSERVVREIWFTFDTDLDKPFPHQDYGRMKIKDWPIHGKAPTCISSLEIRTNQDGEDQTITRMSGNFQRRVKLELPEPLLTDHLVVVPTRNWGFHCFGVYEIRVY